MLKRNWHYLLLLFLVADLSYSFWQYLQFPLDGDMVPIVWPDENVRPVLHDPFGLGVLLRGERHAAPNRFFAMYFFHEYFRHVPLLLQKVMRPVDSLYMACALLKMAVHLLVVYVLAVAVSNRRRVLGKGFLLAAALVSPLLQTSGFHAIIGVIDWSITYTACYALPMALLLLFFLPFFLAAFHGAPLRPSGAGWAGLAGLLVVLSFNGAIIPATALLVCVPTLLLLACRRLAAQPAAPWPRRALGALRGLPPTVAVLFGAFSLLSLYSLFIGTSNSENSWTQLSLAERYARLPWGILYQFTGRETTAHKFGLTLLVAAVLANAGLLRRCLPARQHARVLLVGKYLAVFAVAYLLLLPLGGYRAYRENLVRRDTILPITLGLMGFFALSAYYLLRYLPAPARRRYAALVAGFLGFFTLTDRQHPEDSNARERALFAQLAASPDPVVRLPATATMMDWQPLTDYRTSKLNGQMLYYWHVTATPKLYYQQ